MIPRPLRWLADRFGGDRSSGEKGVGDDEVAEGDDEGREEDEEGGGFLRSRLDASVLSAHGMGAPEAQREIANVERKAEVLEEHRRDE